MVNADVVGFVYLAAPNPDSPDVDQPEHFGFPVMVLVAESGSAPDAFHLHVCSASWLSAELMTERGEALSDSLVTEHDAGVRPLAGVWVMNRWSRERFEAAVRRLCDSQSPAPDWGTVASRISRLLPWEYDYRYDDHADAHAGSTIPPTD